MNPLVWIAVWRIEIEGEYACDDLAVASGVGRSDYAQHLLCLASALKSPGWRYAAAVLMARPSGLEKRIRAVLDTGRDRCAPTLLADVLGALLLLAILLPIAVTGADKEAGSTQGASLQDFQDYFKQAKSIDGILFERVAVDSSGSLWYFGKADGREFYLHQQDFREAIEEPTSLGVTYGGSATNLWHINNASLTVSPIPDRESVFRSSYDEMNHGALVARIGLVTLTRARNLGLGLMDPSTATWEGNRFTASTYDNGKLSGVATVEDGRVTSIEYQVGDLDGSNDSDVEAYVVRYRYAPANLPLGLPSEFEVFKLSKGVERSYGKTRIKKLDLVPSGSLLQEIFDVERFFSPTRIGQRWQYTGFESGAQREHVGPVLKPTGR